MVVVDGQSLEPIKVISTRSSTYDTNEYHPEPRVATIVASHADSEWVVAIKETGMVWLVDYSDLDNLKMTQIETERFLHDGGWDAKKRYLLIAANMRDQMVVVDTEKKKFVARNTTTRMYAVAWSKKLLNSRPAMTETFLIMSPTP